jgi:hypothetical protein
VILKIKQDTYSEMTEVLYQIIIEYAIDRIKDVKIEFDIKGQGSGTYNIINFFQKPYLAFNNSIV